jgi:hypothetical protein
VGLSLSDEGLTDFLKAHQMGFPVYSSPSGSIVASLHLAITPETVLVSPNGFVLGSWNGAYMGGTKTAIEKSLSVSLPSN